MLSVCSQSLTKNVKNHSHHLHIKHNKLELELRRAQRNAQTNLSQPKSTPLCVSLHLLYFVRTGLVVDN